MFRFGSSGSAPPGVAAAEVGSVGGGRYGARRLLVDGSFVTAKDEPHDIDTVILLPSDFQQQIVHEYEPALELEAMR